MTTVNVTTADIDNGTACNSYYCPLALAINRAVNARERGIVVRVIGHYAIIDGRRVSLPDCATHLVDAFDMGGAVKPIEFEINLN